jgi:hypothetical protein
MRLIVDSGKWIVNGKAKGNEGEWSVESRKRKVDAIGGGVNGQIQVLHPVSQRL